MHSDREMILVFGLPRSGTSWLGKIFDSHPGTLYLHEPDKHVQVDGVPVVLPLDSQERPEVGTFLQRVLENRSANVSAKLPVFPKRYRSPGRHLLRTAWSYAVKALPWHLAQRVQVPDLIDPGAGGPRLVWKSINSVGRLGVLARRLPEARAVLILRHPCGQIASILRGHASGRFGIPLPSEQYRVLQLLVDTEQGRAHGLTLDALRALHPVERMAWRWVLLLEKAVADTVGLESCRLLRYEDLCAAPVDGARELFAFTGLAWHSQTEAFIRKSISGETAPYFGLYKDPDRSAGKWRQELAEADVRRVLDVIARSPVGSLYLEEGPAVASRPESVSLPVHSGRHAPLAEAVPQGWSLPS